MQRRARLCERARPTRRRSNHARDRRRSPGTASGSPARDGLSACREQFDVVLLDPPFRGGTLEKILPAVDKCTAPGGTVLCESETGLVLPAQVGGLTLQKQYKYGKVLLWKYTKPMQQEGEAL